MGATVEEGSAWPKRIGLVIATIAVVLWSLTGLANVIKQYASDLHKGIYAGFSGAITGHVIFDTVIVFVALYIFFLRDSDFGRCLRYFVTIALIAIVIDLGITFAVTKAVDQRNAQYVAALTDIKNTLALSKFGSSYIAKYQVTASDDAGQVAMIDRNQTAQLVRLRDGYHAEIQALSLHSVLNPSSLAADGGLEKARTRIALAREIVKKYREAELKVLANTRSAIVSALKSSPDKQKILDGYDKSVQQSALILREYWDCEDQILVETNEMVHDLDHSVAAWTARGKMIIFLSHEDLAAFNKHHQKIREIGMREQELIARARLNTFTVIQNAPAQTD